MVVVPVSIGCVVPVVKAHELTLNTDIENNNSKIDRFGRVSVIAVEAKRDKPLWGPSTHTSPPANIPEFV